MPKHHNTSGRGDADAEREARTKYRCNLRAMYFNAYMHGQMAEIADIASARDRAASLSEDDEKALAKTVQAGLAAKVLLRNMQKAEGKTNPIPLQCSIQEDEDAILESLSVKGYTARELANDREMYRKIAELVILSETARYILADKNSELIALVIDRRQQYGLSTKKGERVYASGMRGLTLSIDAFLPEDNRRLATVASWYIDQPIRNYLIRGICRKDDSEFLSSVRASIECAYRTLNKRFERLQTA